MMIMVMLLLPASLLILRIRYVFYGMGINKYKINKNNDTIHAECDCVDNIKISKEKKLHKKWRKIDLFVIRTNPKGNKLLMAKPCNNCINYIHKNIEKKGFKLNRIYYTDIDSSIKYIK